MSTFGEELRSLRLSRGIALEEITAVTKICQRHLVALEQDHFRQLPGGILSKGIVRGYAGAVGLDERDWTDRFLKASYAAGEPIEEDDRAWTEFAANVGKERLERHEAMQQRMRWIGAFMLLAVAVVATYLTVRFYGVRAGWWDTFLPFHPAATKANALVTHAAALLRQ
jgi:cytoskeletal protein RodZ